MPTALPSSRALSWRKLLRLLSLRLRIETVAARMKRLPASDTRTCRAGCRFLSLSRESYELTGEPEPEDVIAMREVFERPFPDGSTLLSRYRERS
ncbi:hypothetical protein [Methylobacterium sp. Leaf456]|uniref:hypothetical protein n=1 Tax=Methylobacterium sp. Leaf456 TaxID=1736382 RepID=UPI0006FD944B|nr:hypothetical protein [Methylobacterium sp. Leaf456]